MVIGILVSGVAAGIAGVAVGIASGHPLGVVLLLYPGAGQLGIAIFFAAAAMRCRLAPSALSPAPLLH